jgi:hypothetical protein
MTLDQRIAAQGGTVGTQPYTFGNEELFMTSGARRFPRSMSRTGSAAASLYGGEMTVGQYANTEGTLGGTTNGVNGQKVL